MLRTQRQWTLFGLTLAIVGTTAWADHPNDRYPGHGRANPRDAASRLAMEADRLETQVRYTRLSQTVQYSVAVFATDARTLDGCERNNVYRPFAGKLGLESQETEHLSDYRPAPPRPRPRPPYYPPAPPPYYPPAPPPYNPPAPPPPPYRPDPIRNCSYERSKMLTSFDVVERQLYDTSYEYPAVHSQYLRTKAVVDEIRRGPGHYPPAPPSYGQLRSSGLMDGRVYNFVGPTRYDIDRQCLDMVHMYRMDAIYELTVNGHAFGRGRYNPMSPGEACSTVSNNAIH